MAGVGNKSQSQIYGDWFYIDNSNSGFDATLRQIKDGKGNNSALYLSNKSLKIQPASDSTTNTSICDQDGNALLVVDSTNDLVKTGTGQHIVNTQYAHFGIGSGNLVWAGVAAGTHYAVPFNSIATQSLVSGGTGTDPATSFTISTTADDMVGVLWYVMDNITIDRAIWWSANDDAASGNAVRTHLMEYTIDSGNSTTGGDLSSGSVLAYSSDVTNAGYEQAYYNQMTISTANVDSGKAILFFVRGDTSAEDFSINATIKYHLR